MSSLALRMEQYRAGALAQVYGWVGPKAVDALELASEYHRQHAIRGDALEIGVFQGRFFLALLASAEPDEVAVAIDIFDEQALNVDDSGTGDDTKSIFMRNVEQFAGNIDAMRLVEADSMTLRPSDILAQSPHNGYRIISVDGGHTAEHVVNDLRLAGEILVGGAAIFVDDWMSPHWPGVHEGYNRYMSYQNGKLAPVLFTDNKLLMTTIGHQPRMVALMRERFAPWPGQSLADVQSHGFRFLSAA